MELERLIQEFKEIEPQLIKLEQHFRQLKEWDKEDGYLMVAFQEFLTATTRLRNVLSFKNE